VISTDTQHTGAGVETPPAVGMCSVDQVVLVAPTSAPWTGTVLPSAGTATAIRLGRQLAAAGLPGSRLGGGVVGASARPSVQIDARPESVRFEHTSTTPGDLPPEDPLSR
jgi:hypothetical protein